MCVYSGSIWRACTCIYICIPLSVISLVEKDGRKEAERGKERGIYSGGKRPGKRREKSGERVARLSQ